MSVTLRPYQIEGNRQVAAAFNAGARCVVLQEPTGAGKTEMLRAFLMETTGRGAVIAHRRELINQAHRRVVGSVKYPSAESGRIHVGSIQTMGRPATLERLPQYQTIVIDEGHHAVAGQYRALLDSQPKARVLLVTASPERLDGRGLGEIADALVCGPQIAELQDDGYLAAVEVYGAATPPDVRNLHTMAGDFRTADLEGLMTKPRIVGDAVEHYGWLAPSQPTIVFTVSVKAAEDTAKAFRAAGWRFFAVSGETPEHIRDGLLRRLGDGTGEVEGVVSCALIDEGLDVPNVSCVIDMAPTKSLGRFLQRVGRGLRPVYAPGCRLDTREQRFAAIAAGGKRCLTFLDHAGNAFLRHGAPNADRVWSLDGRARSSKDVPSMRQCPECFAVHVPRPTCPACGFDYDAAKAEAERAEIERVEGALRLLTPEDYAAHQLRTRPLKELIKAAETHEQMAAIAAARGYKPGWAFGQMAMKGHRRSFSTNGAELGPL